MNRLSMLGAVAVMGMAGLANAAVVSDSAPFSFNPIGTNVGNPTSVQLDKFDSNLGTLTAVTLSYTQTGIGTFTFVASVNPGDTATATLGSNVQFSFNGGDKNFNSIGSSGPHGPLNVGDSVDVGGPNFGDPAAITDADSGSANNFALYQVPGGGLFNVDITSTGGWTFIVEGSGSASTVTVQFDSSVDGTVAVDYTYTPIPEPASLGLLSLGGLALIRRRAR
ncbi:MAG: choice-of-anchor E domain-containing protein [Phycisphaerales bacterium]